MNLFLITTPTHKLVVNTFDSLTAKQLATRATGEKNHEAMGLTFLGPATIGAPTGILVLHQITL